MNVKPALTVHELVKYYLTANEYFIIEDCENDYIYYQGYKRDFLNYPSDERELAILWGAHIDHIGWQHSLVKPDGLVIYI